MMRGDLLMMVLVGMALPASGADVRGEGDLDAQGRFILWDPAVVVPLAALGSK